MYRIIFTKQAAKDAKHLKSCGLDKKAKELIEVMKENKIRMPHGLTMLARGLTNMESLWEICKDFVRAGLTYSIESYIKL